MAEFTHRGAGVIFSFKVEGEEQAQGMILGIGRRVKDLSPIWPEVDKELRKDAKLMFETEGGQRHPWPPLSEPYATWKQSMVGDKPILVFSGKLKAAATTQSPFHIFKRGALWMETGAALPYAIFHQKSRKIDPGTGKLPRRPFYYIDKKRLARVIGIIRRWAILGEK